MTATTVPGIDPDDRMITREVEQAAVCGMSLSSWRRRKKRMLAGEKGLVPKLVQVGERTYGTTPRWIREWREANAIGGSHE